MDDLQIHFSIAQKLKKYIANVNYMVFSGTDKKPSFEIANTNSS